MGNALAILELSHFHLDIQNHGKISETCINIFALNVMYSPALASSDIRSTEEDVYNVQRNGKPR